MVTCFIGIGSNLGDRRKSIKSAINRIETLKGTEVIKASKVIETEPIGGPAQRKFLNAALKIKTDLAPFDLLKALKKIEKDLGRDSKVRFGPRPIDLDILTYGDRIINKDDLQIPHPRMFEREFVLKPLSKVL